MRFLSMYDTADNGFSVSSGVELLYDEAEPFNAKPWRAETSVNHSRMSTSHHETCAEAKQHAAKMHAAYLEVHSNTAASC